MESGGFKVRVDLSQFFNDIKKFSCIYVDLSRDRQIVDVVDRISKLFGIEEPLLLLDERFYLPESENVNVLRDSNVVKVLKAFHSKSWESCSATDHLLKNEINFGKKSFKIHKSGISGTFGQNGDVTSASVSHTGKEIVHEVHGKKRKHQEFDKSEYTINDMNILQQGLEPGIHYQKRCKRKKERIKKEVLSENISEHVETELEGKNNNDIDFEIKHKKRKKRNREINRENSEDRACSVVMCHNSHETLSDLNELATSDSRNLKKHEKKIEDDSVSLATQKHKTVDSVSPHSTSLKKHKKKFRQNVTDTMTEDQSQPFSSDKAGTELLSASSQDVQKCRRDSTLVPKNIETLINNNLENNDSIEHAQSDIALSAVSSTPTLPGGSKTRGGVHFPLQTNAHESTLESLLDNGSNIVLSMKPKRKRIRTRKHKKKNIVQDDNIVSLPCGVPQPAVSQSFIPSRKHIRFEEEFDKNVEENIRHKEVNLDDDTGFRNNITEEVCGSKESTDLNTECSQEPTAETEARDCPMKDVVENSISENLRNNNESASSPVQPTFYQQWALNTAKLGIDSKESLQKLLALGKQNSFPVIFERKSQSNNSSSTSESPTPVSKKNNTNTEETCVSQNKLQVMDTTNMTCPKTDPNTVDPLRYPQLEGKPKKNDIIAFKVLKLTASYTPEVSDFIIAKVLSICDDTAEMLLQIEVGESHLETPKGKFSLENKDSEKNDNDNDSDSKLRQLNWNELMDIRILFP